MTPRFQTLSNNCLQASLASILDLPLDAVPHVFAAGPCTGAEAKRRWGWLMKWAKGRGYNMVFLKENWVLDWKRVRELASSGSYYIGIVPMGGGDNHAVVMRYGKQVFDPRGNYGILGKPTDYVVLERRKARLFPALCVMAALYLFVFWMGDMVRSGHVIRVWKRTGFARLMRDELRFNHEVLKKFKELSQGR